MDSSSGSSGVEAILLAGDSCRTGNVRASPFVTHRLCTIALVLILASLAGCTLPRGPGGARVSGVEPLTTSGALGLEDSRRDASLRLVISGLDEDAAGRPARALASYQRAVRVDSTNPFAYLALARHHIEGGAPREASAFLDQARSLFESQQQLGPAVDVWGIGLRAWIDREEGRDALADERFASARELSEVIWSDERLSARELR